MVSPGPIISPRNKDGYPIEAHGEAGRQLLRCIRSNRCRVVCHVPAYLFLKITVFFYAGCSKPSPANASFSLASILSSLTMFTASL